MTFFLFTYYIKFYNGHNKLKCLRKVVPYEKFLEDFYFVHYIFFISAIYLGSHSYTKIYREESLNNMNIIKENKSSEKVNSREENKKEVIKKKKKATVP